MTVAQVIGIDPGLVHTGVVKMTFTLPDKTVFIDHKVVLGPNAEEVKEWLDQDKDPLRHIFIEKYQPRSHFSGDSRMVTAVSEMAKALPGSKIILNTGVQKVVRPRLMKLLGLWLWPTATNHQDLRAASYIALYGMLKNPELNDLLANLVGSDIIGDPWVIQHH